jgi:para-aminobenzoate synthetase/4-amino-4-deoxychorismate lyase
MVSAPYLLFDDARPGGEARLYRAPVRIVAAYRLEEVRGAIDELRRATAGGAHAAGYLAYEAGQALDPMLVEGARDGDGPLLWFGLFEGFERPDPERLLPDGAGAFIGRPRPRIGFADYAEAAGKVRDHLFAGDLYQANLTFGCDVSVQGDPLAIYARLRAGSTAGWGGVVHTGERWLVSCSPEQFFTIRDGVIEARPMKGTAPRHASPERDRAEADGLASDEKQRAENLMIVDLMRNDLARLSVPGSVDVPDLFVVEQYPTVHQMVSRITARLRPETSAADVIETIFPCGSVTGAPKVAAIRALRRLEPEPRGAYTGSMGWIEPGPQGDAAFNVLIRTLEGRSEQSTCRLGLGSGLVVDSRIDDEWAECRLKGEFVLQGQRPFDLVETMGLDPHDGIVDLDRHLDRLRNAAADLNFRFDRHAARNELQAATFGHKERSMVRLLLARSGAMAIQLRPFERPPESPVRVTLAPLPVPANDFRLRYKTTDRGFYDQARQDAGTFETVFYDDHGRITEGTRTCVFVERDGVLVTPPLSQGLVPGVLRGKLIDEGRAVEGQLVPDDLAGGFLIGNSARGLLAAVLG